jgi:hypothetical protein
MKPSAPGSGNVHERVAVPDASGVSIRPVHQAGPREGPRCIGAAGGLLVIL